MTAKKQPTHPDGLTYEDLKPGTLVEQVNTAHGSSGPYEVVGAPYRAEINDSSLNGSWRIELVKDGRRSSISLSDFGYVPYSPNCWNDVNYLRRYVKPFVAPELTEREWQALGLICRTYSSGGSDVTLRVAEKVGKIR